MNEWSQSKLMNLLNNGAYYNRANGTCYNGENNATTACDFSESGLTSEAKDMIDTVTWNTGNNGTNSYTTEENGLVTFFYNLERGSFLNKICDISSSCNDNVLRTTNWLGKVGLIYPSDYGYAMSGGSLVTRNICFNKALYQWADGNVNDCMNNNWLYQSNTFKWTISSIANATNAFYAFHISIPGRVYGIPTSDSLSIHPAIYLKIKANFIEGVGSEENLYF